MVDGQDRVRRRMREITRRDFLEGVLIGAAGLGAGSLLFGCDKAADAGAADSGGGTPLVIPPGADRGDKWDLCHALRDGQTWATPEPDGPLLDCVIVGGGISGLVAGWRLRKSGVDDLLILEKEARPGGLSRRDDAPPHSFSQATAYTVFPYNDSLIELYTDLGAITGTDDEGEPIVDPKFLAKAPANNAWMEGTWVEDAWEEGMDKVPRPPKVVEELKAFRDAMKEFYDYEGADGAAGFDTPSDASTTDPEIRALDEVTLAEWVASKGWDPRVSEFWDPYARSAFGTTHDRLSCWAAINFLGSEFLPILTQPGGNAWIAEKLEELVGSERIRTSAFVTRIANVDGEVHVTYLLDGEPVTVRARRAIFAAPRFTARRLVPELAAVAGRDEQTHFRYTPYIVAQIHVTRTPKELGYDTWFYGDTFFTDIIVADWTAHTDPANASEGRPNVLTAYCPRLESGARKAMLTTPMDEYVAAILGDLERVLPGIVESVTAVDIYRWGHAMLAPERGFVFGEARVGAQLPQGAIHFANTDVDGLPAFENAVAAAVRAADEVTAAI
ncbi:MAG: hypothetical protein AMXMBFR64_58700 [Myxococcales bacterium]